MSAEVSTQLKLEGWDEAYTPNPNDYSLHRTLCFAVAGAALRRAERLLSEPFSLRHDSVKTAIHNRENALALLKLGAKNDPVLESRVNEIIGGLPSPREMLLRD